MIFNSFSSLLLSVEPRGLPAMEPRSAPCHWAPPLVLYFETVSCWVVQDSICNPTFRVPHTSWMSRVFVLETYLGELYFVSCTQRRRRKRQNERRLKQRRRRDEGGDGGRGREKRRETGKDGGRGGGEIGHLNWWQVVVSRCTKADVPGIFWSLSTKKETNLYASWMEQQSC